MGGPRRLGAALGALLLGSVLGACGVTDPAPPDPAPPVSTSRADPTATPAALPPVDCSTSVRTGPLPDWARAGFTGDGSSFRHVEGRRGRVVGVLFGYPLSAPARPDRANKILWVDRDRAGGRLTLSARLDGSGPAVVRDVGFGGGQSIVDLPRAGCWRLSLTWDDELGDVVDVPYVPRSSRR